MSVLGRRVEERAVATGFTGVVRVERSGAVEVDAAYGLADRRHGVAMTTGHRLAMASGSKTFTALVVLRLVEDGVLALSTPVRRLLGDDLPLVADDVTVEHLLSHRSGIGDYLDEDELDVEDYPMPVSVHRLATTEDYLLVLDGHTATSAAGERFSYCNGGFVVLALVAERAAGRSFHDLVHELVCVPAGMTGTAYLRSDALPGDAALGYVEDDARWRTNVFHLPVVGSGDGGAYTSTDDVARFWAALTSGRIVSARTLTQMCTPRSEPGPAGRQYGLGIWMRRGSSAITMSGEDAGVSFWSSHDPGGDWTATVVSNTTHGARAVVEVVQAES